MTTSLSLTELDRIEVLTDRLNVAKGRTLEERKKRADQVAALLKTDPVPAGAREALARAGQKYLKAEEARHEAAAEYAERLAAVKAPERQRDYAVAVLQRELRDTSPAAVAEYRMRLYALSQSSECRSSADLTRDQLVARIQAVDAGMRRCDELLELALTDEELAGEFARIEKSIGVAPPPASRGL